MAHAIEAASSGRAKCRGCGQPIAKGELRFGERLSNPFGEGEMTLWFHLSCAAHKRPEPLLEAMQATAQALQDPGRLESVARQGLAHQRLPRIDGVQRAPSGRAACRHCRQPIAKQAWRISLVYYEEGRFEPAGFVHVKCAAGYFETGDVLERLKQFSPGLSETELVELRAELESGASEGSVPEAG